VIYRLIGIFVFAATIALGFAAGHLGLTLLSRQIFVENSQERVLATMVVEPSVQALEITPWPAAFGQYIPDPPPPEPVVEQAPIVNYAYRLKGLFSVGTNAWAIVDGTEGEVLLKLGDELPGGAIVTDISPEGVWLKAPTGRELIAFEE